MGAATLLGIYLGKDGQTNRSVRSFYVISQCDTIESSFVLMFPRHSSSAYWGRTANVSSLHRIGILYRPVHIESQYLCSLPFTLLGQERVSLRELEVSSHVYSLTGRVSA